jgi:hypothetical protein
MVTVPLREIVDPLYVAAELKLKLFAEVSAYVPTDGRTPPASVKNWFETLNTPPEKPKVLERGIKSLPALTAPETVMMADRPFFGTEITTDAAPPTTSEPEMERVAVPE